MNYELIKEAFKYYGEKEVGGSLHNDVIVSMFEDAGHPQIDDDETAWCAAFIGAICHRTKHEKSGMLNAQSYLKLGYAVENIQDADIVVFWRDSPDSWKGHVGIPIRDDGENIWTLGGNQSNQINIKPYPKYRVKGFRKLKKLTD